ncbi:hypothetical protein ACMV8I_12625 [Ewingella sp. S1.OA.A_B6]
MDKQVRTKNESVRSVTVSVADADNWMKSGVFIEVPEGNIELVIPSRA